MKLIRNKSVKPIRVPLGGSKVLHLNPAKEAQVADDAVERPAFKRLVEEGTIEVIGSGTQQEGGEDKGPVTGQSQAHTRSTFQRGHGER